MKNYKLMFIIATAMLIFHLPGYAQDKAANIDRLMRTYKKYDQFNGTVLVAEKGQIIFKKGFGSANMEWNIPNEPDVKFRLGSITKQFTSMLIMQLVEEGKIKLQNKITAYLPDYPKKYGDKVSVHHLLTHTSGIPSYTNLPDFFEKLSRNPYTPDEFIKTFCNMDFKFEPGSSYSYNNSGYFLLGLIIEKVTGKPYEQVLQERILQPLGMKDSGYDHFEKIIPRRAAGYAKRAGGYENAPYLDMSIPYAAGSMYSTVEDLYKWDQALYTEKLLSEKYKKIMFTPFLQHYAYGYVVQKIKPEGFQDSLFVIEHGGGINGFNTLITRLVEDKNLIVLLNNTGAARLQEISRKIIRILYDKRFELPKTPVSYLLRQAKNEEEIASILTKYRTSPDKYAVNEIEINNIGYQFLNHGMQSAAIQIFKFNVETHPKSANCYDSLGEAFLKAGKTELAVGNYRKALQLNPRFESAKKMLKKLGEKVDENLGKEIKLPAEILRKYIGKYQLKPDFILTITAEGNRLFAQATGQQKFEIFAMSQNRFFLKVVEAQILFNLDKDGKPESLTLFQSGAEMLAKKIE